MYTLSKLQSHDYFEARRAAFHVPADEYRFAAVLKRGPLISAQGKPLTVCAIDAAPEPLVFPMSLLTASSVAAAWPQFETTGLLAWWKLTSDGGSAGAAGAAGAVSGAGAKSAGGGASAGGPWLTLDSVPRVKVPTDARSVLLDTSSAAFVRDRYAAFFKNAG